MHLILPQESQNPEEGSSGESEERSVVGLDFDDVVNEFNASLLRYLNERFGRNFVTADVKTYLISDLLGCTMAEGVRIAQDFYATKEHDETVPVEGAIDGIPILRNHHDLVIVTARPSEMEERTHTWITRNFGTDVFKGVHFANVFKEGNGRSCKKSEICDEIGVKKFVEDNLDNAFDIGGNGRPVYLFNKPWNAIPSKPLPSNIIRVFSWNDVVRELCPSIAAKQ